MWLTPAEDEVYSAQIKVTGSNGWGTFLEQVNYIGPISLGVKRTNWQYYVGPSGRVFDFNVTYNYQKNGDFPSSAGSFTRNYNQNSSTY